MKFKDVTLCNQEVIDAMREKGKVKGEIKIYECDATTVIYSNEKNTKHASLSNPNRSVKFSEIDWALELLDLKYGLFRWFQTQTGVVHIHSVGNKAPQ